MKKSLTNNESSQSSWTRVLSLSLFAPKSNDSNEVKELKSECLKLFEENKQLKKHFDDQDKRMTVQDTHIAAQATHIASLHEELVKAKNDIEKLKKINEELKKENQELKKENQKLEEFMHQMQKEKKDQEDSFILGQISFKFQELILNKILTSDRRKELRLNTIEQLRKDQEIGRLKEHEKEKFDEIKGEWKSRGCDLELLDRTLKNLIHFRLKNAHPSLPPYEDIQDIFEKIDENFINLEDMRVVVDYLVQERVIKKKKNS